MFTEVRQLSASVTQRQLEAAVAALCADPRIDGVLVQLPLPAHIDEEAVIDRFDPLKDVDGFHPLNMGEKAGAAGVLEPGKARPLMVQFGASGRGGGLGAHPPASTRTSRPPAGRILMRGRAARFIPCTALGVIELLKRSGVVVRGKSVVVMGDSNIVGVPLAMLFRDAGAATVTVLHRTSYRELFTDATSEEVRGPAGRWRKMRDGSAARLARAFCRWFGRRVLFGRGRAGPRVHCACSCTHSLVLSHGMACNGRASVPVRPALHLPCLSITGLCPPPLCSAPASGRRLLPVCHASRAPWVHMRGGEPMRRQQQCQTRPRRVGGMWGQRGLGTALPSSLSSRLGSRWRARLGGARAATRTTTPMPSTSRTCLTCRASPAQATSWWWRWDTPTW